MYCKTCGDPIHGDSCLRCRVNANWEAKIREREVKVFYFTNSLRAPDGPGDAIVFRSLEDARETLKRDHVEHPNDWLEMWVFPASDLRMEGEPYILRK